MKKYALVGITLLALGGLGYFILGWSTYENKEYGFRFEYPSRLHVLTNGSQNDGLIQISDKSDFEKNEDAFLMKVYVEANSSTNNLRSTTGEKRLEIAALKTRLNVPVTADFSGDPPYGIYSVSIPLEAQHKLVRITITIPQSDLPEYGGENRDLKLAKEILTTFNFTR